MCEAIDNVIRGEYTQAFCAIRPPGHHVGKYGRTKPSSSLGYCLLNNVAIGAKYPLIISAFNTHQHTTNSEDTNTTS